MKLVLMNVIVILATSTALAQATSPKAFEKLTKMFEAASTPKNLEQVIAEVAKIKGCAGTTAEAPDQIDNVPWLTVAHYTSPSFGPGFPAETFTGIGLNEASVTRNEVGSDFFAGYSSQLSSQGLEIVSSSYFYTETECDYDHNDKYKCHTYSRSEKINLTLKLSAQFIHYIQGNGVAYCWK